MPKSGSKSYGRGGAADGALGGGGGLLVPAAAGLGFGAGLAAGGGQGGYYVTETEDYADYGRQRGHCGRGGRVHKDSVCVEEETKVAVCNETKVETKCEDKPICAKKDRCDDDDCGWSCGWIVLIIFIFIIIFLIIIACFWYAQPDCVTKRSDNCDDDCDGEFDIGRAFIWAFVIVFFLIIFAAAFWCAC